MLTRGQKLKRTGLWQLLTLSWCCSTRWGCKGAQYRCLACLRVHCAVHVSAFCDFKLLPVSTPYPAESGNPQACDSLGPWWAEPACWWAKWILCLRSREQEPNDRPWKLSAHIPQLCKTMHKINRMHPFHSEILGKASNILLRHYFMLLTLSCLCCVQWLLPLHTLCQ